VCPAGHAFDVARRGYLNLLQPQDRRSLDAGDSSAVVAARAALWAAGIGQGLVQAVVSLAAAVTANPPVVVDLGAGTGDALGALATARPIVGVGIDVSAAAAAHAAGRFPALTWVVANADRRLPILDESVDLVLSIHGRRNPTECARILRPGGTLIAAIPAPDDLIELRATVLGQGAVRTRHPRLVEEYRTFLTLQDGREVRERRVLGPDLLQHLLRVTYRGARTSQARNAEALSAMEVTLASDLCHFTRR
jgi:23S rRNA (guanine745-N1)-methyltransferase